MGTRYEFTVMAYNSLGDSEYQPIGINATTSSKFHQRYILYIIRITVLVNKERNFEFLDLI